MDMLLELIELAQGMLETGFDVQIFQNWEFLALVALSASLGPLHYYTQNFKRLTLGKNKKALLAGEGILMAAKETLAQQKASEPQEPCATVHIRAEHSALLKRLHNRLCECPSR